MADVSPITHLRDSTIFDFPQPFGPTIPVSPSSIKKLVLSAKDLTSDITLFDALYFEVYLYVYDGIGDFDEVAISLKELKETQKRIEKNNKALGILTKKIIESIE